jgi:hypothetical protein
MARRMKAAAERAWRSKSRANRRLRLIQPKSPKPLPPPRSPLGQVRDKSPVRFGEGCLQLINPLLSTFGVRGRSRLNSHIIGHQDPRTIGERV